MGDDLDEVNWIGKALFCELVSWIAGQEDEQHEHSLLRGSWWWEKCEQLSSTLATRLPLPQWSVFLKWNTINHPYTGQFVRCSGASTKKTINTLAEHPESVVGAPNHVLVCVFLSLKSLLSGNLAESSWKEIAMQHQDFCHNSLTCLLLSNPSYNSTQCILHYTFNAILKQTNEW